MNETARLNAERVPACLAAASAVALLAYAGLVYGEGTDRAGQRGEPRKPPAIEAWIKAGKPSARPVRTLEELARFEPAHETKTDRYGGQLGSRLKATGFFRVKKVGGRWWLVTPEGNRFLHVAVNSVAPQRGPSFRGAFSSRFDSNDDWARQTVELLRETGFNGTGSWADNGLLQRVEPRLTYTRTVNFMSAFGKKLGITRQGSGHQSYPDQLIPVFHPEFPAFCREKAAELISTRDDPYLLGVFSDNELEHNGRSLDLHLCAETGSPERQAAEAWLRRRRGESADTGPPTNKERSAYVGHVFGAYFSTVGEAIRSVDGNHLYLGPRLHGAVTRNRHVLAAAGRHLDVIAINLYGVWTPRKNLRRWVKWSGRPVMITEFYAKGADSGMANLSGAGWTVPTQRDRGRFYQHFTLSLLESRGCVGWHYFKYADNDPLDTSTDPSNRDSNKGLLDSRYEPWREMLDGMRPLNKQVYPLTRHFDAEGPESKRD